MDTGTRNKPIYVFRITPKISLIWTALGLFLFILAASSASWFYGKIHGQSSLNFSLEGSQDNFWENILPFLSLFAIILGTAIIHELVHGVAFTAFGGSPRYGVKVKYFLPLAYATSPGDYFRRNAFIVIGLAPLIVIEAIILVVSMVFTAIVQIEQSEISSMQIFSELMVLSEEILGEFWQIVANMVVGCLIN